MAKSRHPLDRILEQGEQAAKAAVSQELHKLQQAVGLSSDWTDLPQWSEDAEDGIEVEEPATPAILFDNAARDANLANAVGAYRLLGSQPHLVAQNKHSGAAFFGTESQLLAHIAAHDEREADWQVLENALDLEFDPSGMRQILHLLDAQPAAWQDAKNQYSQFHWGDKLNTLGLMQIPGVDGPACFLGVARKIEYGAQKDGQFHEYFHNHGEESGQFPALYGIGPVDGNGNYRAYVVSGGNMRVTERGIVD